MRGVIVVMVLVCAARMAGGPLSAGELDRHTERLPPVGIGGSPQLGFRRLPPVEVESFVLESSRVVMRPADSPRHAARPAQFVESPPAVDAPPPVVEELFDSVIPADFVPWWQRELLRPLRGMNAELTVDLNSLIVDTLRHSSQVRAISDNVIIAQTSIARAQAEFDVHAFMESKFVRTSVPTGSTLDAGFNVPRLRDEDFFYSAGVRRKNEFGGKFEVAQQFGSRDSNSQFFFPSNQGNARFTLSYNQPILNGAGECYNSSLIVLADIDTRIAAQRTAAELQDQLLVVTEAMWELFRQRAVLIQKRRHQARAAVILERLEKRREVDSLESQIARARAAVSMRRSEVIRADTSARNAESNLRAQVNSPAMLANRHAELVPIQIPTRDFLPISLEESMLTALENRAEVNTAIQEIDAARVRLGIAQNELLPVLDVVLETYVTGLQGDYDVGQAWVDQFGDGEPSYTAGFVFEVPLYRRAANAALQRRQVELRQLTSRFQIAVEQLHAEVEIAVREVETAYRELQAKYTSMVAAEIDVQYLQRRWEELPGDDRAASFLLADLLDSQDRLAFEELGFASAQVDYALSLTKLNRATGTLLKHERVEAIEAYQECLPMLLYEKTGVWSEE